MSSTTNGRVDAVSGAVEGPGEAAGDALSAPAGHRKPATIYDIAQLAGVDPSTVSRALSKPGRINPKTAQKIQEAAKALNYRVNPAARALPTGRTSTIGLIVADITNPMFFDIVRGAEREAAEQNYTLVLAEFHEAAERELLTAHRLMPSVDGLILATTRLDPDRIRELADEKPVVVINREVEGVTTVMSDVDPGVREAIAHLAALGHERIAYLPGPARSWMSRRRLEAIQERGAEARLTVTALPGEQPTMDGGRAAADSVLASGATAVIAYNDLQAIGLVLEFGERSIAVPAEISVIGFDNIFGADFTTPPLTSIGAPHMESGMHAARGIFGLLGGAGAASVGTQLTTALVVRGSTGAAPRPAVRTD